MQRFNVLGLMAALHNLHLASGALYQNVEGAKEKLCESLQFLDKACVGTGLYPVSRQAKRIIRYATELGMHDEAVNTLAMDLHRAVMDELKGRGLFQLLPQEVPYFTGEYFEKEISDRFPDARYDLLEAGKCFALSCYTATAFHLMRAFEVGLQAFLGHANVMVSDNPSWGIALNACEQAGADKEMIANLRAVKNAWRDPTMHVERQYNQEQADELIGAVRAFLRRLARTI